MVRTKQQKQKKDEHLPPFTYHSSPLTEKQNIPQLSCHSRVWMMFVQKREKQNKKTTTLSLRHDPHTVQLYVLLVPYLLRHEDK